MVEYGVVVWVPARRDDDPCYMTTPKHRVVETVGEALEFIRKHSGDVCEAKIYRIAGDRELEDFCDDINWDDPRCEALEEELDEDEG